MICPSVGRRDQRSLHPPLLEDGQLVLLKPAPCAWRIFRRTGEDEARLAPSPLGVPTPALHSQDRHIYDNHQQSGRRHNFRMKMFAQNSYLFTFSKYEQVMG